MGLFGNRAKTPERQLQSIVAASKRLELSSDELRDQALKRIEEWQTRSWELYDEIGEVRFAARYMGDALARLRLYPAYREYPNGPPIPLVLPEDDDPERAKTLAELPFTEEEVAIAQDALARLRSPLGGQSEIQRRLGVQLFVPGEGYLVVEPLENDPAGETERWEVYSSEELILDKDHPVELSDGTRVPSLKIRGPDRNVVRTLPPESVAYRIWRPHARYRDWADSPMRPARGILDELALLTRAVRGATISRLKGPGILFMPNSLKGQPTANAPQQQGAGQANLDPVTRDLLEAMALAIQDPGAASSQIPVVVWIRDELWNDLDVSAKHLTWTTDIDEVLATRRAECLKRFAVAIDLPAEVLTGMGDVKYWNLEYIGAEGFRSHIEPYAVTMVDALTNVYFRPALLASGIEDPTRFCIWYDTSELVSEPDPTDKALKANEAFLISDKTTRREIGYSEDDAPSEEEIAERITRARALAGNGPLAIEAPAVTPEPPEPGPQAAIDAAIHDVAFAQTAVELAESRRLERFTQAIADLDAGLLREAHSRADQAMRRALERANSRLRSLTNGNAKAKAAIANLSVDAFEIAPALGPILIRQLVAAEDTDEALFGGAFAGYLAWWDDRVQRAGSEIVRLTGAAGDLPAGSEDQYEAAMAEDRQAGSWALSAALGTLAGALLLRPEVGTGPGETDGSLVPPGVVRGALARAGGGGEKATSLATGQRFTGLFGAAGITFEGWQWNYGDASARHQPFEPHRALDGMVFADFDDDRLANTVSATGYGWPGVTHWLPGDHLGCLCQSSRVGARVSLPTLVPVTQGGTRG